MEPAAVNLPESTVSRHRVFAADANDPGLAARLFDEVLASSLNVVTLYTRNGHEILEQLRVFTRRSAQSVYWYSAEVGLCSMRQDDIVVPGSKRLIDAIKHVSSTAHFGLYVFSDIGDRLNSPLIAQLRTFSRQRSGSIERRILMLEQKLDIPASLGEHCHHLLHQPRSAGRMRLRDGRWGR